MYRSDLATYKAFCRSIYCDKTGYLGQKFAI